ncbi:MAG: prolipoprotein diacylglyceryl transferase [Deltaproteobacteria bacterium]|nr:prolipoprotein diacylglyceryl transferase [Candidatus Zymogenaceae bacterium]
MHPELFTIGEVVVHSYGVFVTLGLLAAVVSFLWELKRRDDSFWIGVDILLLMISAGLLGAKLFHVLFSLSDYQEGPHTILSLIFSGWSAAGGLLGSLLALVIYFRKKGLDGWYWMDTLIPSVPLAQTIMRVGCLMTGCCYGKPTHLPWAITFTKSTVAPLGVPLHPTQAYHLAANLLIYLFLTIRKKRSAFPGELTLAYVLFYTIQRSVIDVFRADPGRLWLWDTITTYQLIGTIAVIVVIFLYRSRMRTVS